MQDQPTPEEFRRLGAHHRRTWIWFIVFWTYTPLMMLAIAFLDVPAPLANVLIAIMFAGAVAAGVLQFSARCPGCGANLGLQVRLGIPETCGKCGLRLRPAGKGGGQ